MYFCEGSTERSSLLSADVQKLLLELESDLEFLTSGAKVVNDAYRKALQATEHKMMELSWSAVGFEELVKKVRHFEGDLKGFVQEGGGAAGVNLHSVKAKLLEYLKDLYSKKHTAASHLLVFMIADGLRNHKPYAISVRFMPYRSLTDAKMRQLELQLEEAMRCIGMTVVGMYLKTLTSHNSAINNFLFFYKSLTACHSISGTNCHISLFWKPRGQE